MLTPHSTFFVVIRAVIFTIATITILVTLIIIIIIIIIQIGLQDVIEILQIRRQEGINELLDQWTQLLRQGLRNVRLDFARKEIDELGRNTPRKV